MLRPKKWTCWATSSLRRRPRAVPRSRPSLQVALAPFFQSLHDFQQILASGRHAVFHPERPTRFYCATDDSVRLQLPQLHGERLDRDAGESGAEFAETTWSRAQFIDDTGFPASADHVDGRIERAVLAQGIELVRIGRGDHGQVPWV